MEMCQGGDIFEKIGLIGNFTEKMAANLFRQMICAVSHCHTKKICHKDLKPENFLFESTDPSAKLKLIDFGLSQFFENPSINPFNILLLLGKGKVTMTEQVGTVCFL